MKVEDRTILVGVYNQNIKYNPYRVSIGGSK